MTQPIHFELNGRPRVYWGDPGRSLLSWLRGEAGLTSVKDGCSAQGFCRACTVEINGKARLSCLTKMSSLSNGSVTTLDGLPEKVRDVLARVFVEHGAVQCGFCSPGFLARARLLLEENPTPSRADVVKALRHHFCRCTGYLAIIDAVLAAAEALKETTTASDLSGPSPERSGSPALPSPGLVTRARAGEEAQLLAQRAQTVDIQASRARDEPVPPAGGRGHLALDGVGASHPKYRASEKALGIDPFIDDLRIDGLLHGALRFTDHPRARVLSIETQDAERMEGVVRVFLASDVPGERSTGLVRRDWPLMVAPLETTRCVGDVIALVIATSEDVAREAAGHVRVEYEVLEPVSDPHVALLDIDLVDPGGNLLSETVIRRGGDAEEALSAARYVTRGTFRTQRVEHAFLEVEAAIARSWRPPRDGAGLDETSTDGLHGLEVFSSGQGAYVDQEQIASLLSVPVSRIKVTQVSPGGAFGGKEDLSVQGHAALAAWLLRRPVKVKLDRAESIRMHPKRHPMIMDYAVGCDEEGRLSVVRARILGDTGAYASVGAKILERAAGHATGAYHVPVVDLVARAVYTNNVPSGAMRGFGVNQVTFAMESCLDDLCLQGGFDRWQMRYDNAVREGSMTATGQVLSGGVGLRETLLAVKHEYEHGRHVGLSCGLKNCGVGNGRADSCEVLVEVVSASRVLIKHGWTEMGQGIHTVAQQILSELTGLPASIVDLVVCTEDGAKAGMTTSSRGTSLLGNALIDAGRALRHDLDVAGGDLAKLAGRVYRGRWSFEDSTSPGASGQVVTHYSYGYATQLVLLDDRGRIERVVAAHDAGRVMNPVLFKGQVVGAVHMGLGYALEEKLEQDMASAPSGALRDLGILPMTEMPDVDVIAVEVPDPLGPFGAKGVGEIGLVPTAAAVALAYRAFDGEPRFELPLNIRRERTK